MAPQEGKLHPTAVSLGVLLQRLAGLQGTAGWARPRPWGLTERPRPGGFSGHLGARARYRTLLQHSPPSAEPAAAAKVAAPAGCPPAARLCWGP